MILISYQKKDHKKIIRACVLALKKGKVVAYPTDTSYGFAVDATNQKAVIKLYKTKGRDFNKPSSLIMPNRLYAKKIANWSPVASKLAKKFWPGAITLALPLKKSAKFPEQISGGTGFVGLRLPKNLIALDLAHQLKKPITATSANLAGREDSYSAKDILTQFKGGKLKPDIILDGGALPRIKPSTLVKIQGSSIEIIRSGPISKKQIIKALTK